MKKLMCFGLLCMAVVLMSNTVHAVDPLKRVAKLMASKMKKFPNRRVAVLNFPYHNQYVSSGSTLVQERLTTYLAQCEEVEIIERNLINKLLDEMKLEQTGMIDPETTKKIGKMLGVTGIVTGTLNDLNNNTTEVYARIIHTESGKILAAECVQIRRTWKDQAVPIVPLAPKKETAKEPAEAPAEPAQQPVVAQKQPYSRPSSAPSRSYKNTEFILKIGADFNGKEQYSGTYEEDDYYYPAYSNDFDIEKDVTNGTSLSAEFVYYCTNNLGLGVGLTYQTARKLTDKEGNFYYVPIYGIFKLRATGGAVSPYFITHLGYNSFNADDKYLVGGTKTGGPYYGFGGGVTFENGLLFELLFSVNQASYEYSQEYTYWTWGSYYYNTYTETGDITYKKVTFAVGYAF